MLSNVTLALRTMRWVGHVACMGVSGNACRLLVEKREEKRLLQRPGGYYKDRMGECELIYFASG